MRKTVSIFHYELKMQAKRPAVWGVFLAATAMAQLDCFPSAQNLARLEFLNQPAYFVHRVMTLDALLLLFGLAILLANRFPADRKTPWATCSAPTPWRGASTSWASCWGGFCLAYLLTALFLLCNTAVYVLAAPFAIAPWEWLLPLGKALALCAFPASWFTGLAAVALPGLVDIRLFYAAAALFFGWNAATVGSAESMPFCLLTAGDLSRLLWAHPKCPGWRGEVCWQTPRSSWAGACCAPACPSGSSPSGGAAYETPPAGTENRRDKLPVGDSRPLFGPGALCRPGRGTAGLRPHRL